MGRRNRLMAMLTVFLALLLFLVINPGDDTLLATQIATFSATIIFIGHFLYNHIFWRMPPFNSIHNIIDISGNWKGKAIDEVGAETSFEMKVTQHFDDVKVKITGDEYISESLICRLKRESNGLFLYFMYRSRPIDKVTSKRDISFGSMIIRCDPDVLTGEFFTTKNDKNKIELYRD
ncbi:TPA: hypothetical protein GXZ34_03300 [bacterium]|nr:hypothetical protein [bacterium]